MNPFLEIPVVLKTRNHKLRLTTVGALLSIFLPCNANTSGKPDAIVAADGSGNFKTVQEAVNSTPADKQKLYLIHIKPGVYKEKITIPAGTTPIKLEGEEAVKTILTFDDCADTLEAGGQKIGTFRSASVSISARNFFAENITFENSHGKRSQALAVSVSINRAVFRKCRFLGWQDTVLLQSGRQYFEECFVAGHVDFIFGGATAFFERCEIHCLDNGYITAASTPEDHAHGFVFANCKITTAPGDWKIYLGRPWRPFASVTFLNTEMPAEIRPEGWHNWNDPEREKTARFAEHQSAGPGANPSARVPWSRQLTDAEAGALTPQRVLGWDPNKGLSAENISALPQPAQQAWWDYLQRSADHLHADKAALEAEVKEHNLPGPIRLQPGGDYKLSAKVSSDWFGSPEAQELAEAVVSFQTPSGGWSKKVSFEKGPRKPGTHWSSQNSENEGWHYVGTFDNRATTDELMLLAGVHRATKREEFRSAFSKGLDYIFDAQYPNGGWPQVYPLEGGYHDAITFNDNAMRHVLELLRDIADNKPEFSFVDDNRRSKARKAVAAGLQCILDTQVLQHDRRTVWCAQHDPLSLAPCDARLKEPASLSGGESVGVVKFLMQIPNPSPEIVKAIEDALAWFERSKFTGLRATQRDGRSFFEQDRTATKLYLGALLRHRHQPAHFRRCAGRDHLRFLRGNVEDQPLWLRLLHKPAGEFDRKGSGEMAKAHRKAVEIAARKCDECLVSIAARFREICMKSLSRLLFLFSAALLANSAFAADQAAPPVDGYQDTPLIPGTVWHVHDGTRPQPKIVTPGEPATQERAGTAPGDAVVLFDGTDLSKWRDKNGGPAKWKVENGIATVGGGDIFTRDEFGPDMQLHVEYAAPVPAEGRGQKRGNSGIFFFGRYEIQVLDNYDNPTYPDGQASAIYSYMPPLVNACRKPGEWQTYDIIFAGPRFKDGKLEKPAFVTVLHNGVLTQNHVALIGDMAHRNVGRYHLHPEKGPIKLQDHNNPVRYRSIWIREFKQPGPDDLGTGPVLDSGPK